jgi:translation initiation factor IF-3
LLGRRRRGIPLPPPETNRARVNERIKVPQIRLIDEEGKQVGVVPTDDGRKRAVAAGLDLVEVAAEAKPPVCRIMDYGKFLFEQQKKDRAQKSHSHRSETKEVRLRPRTGGGDFDIKVKHAREFLVEGYKVGVHVQFRGRELSHKELGLEILQRFKIALEDIAKMEQEPRQEGRRMVALLAPRNQNAGSAAADDKDAPAKDA